LQNNKEDFYHKFKLDEPWDSPTNLMLLDQMPWPFAEPSYFDDPTSVTYYQVFVGPGTLFEGKEGAKLADFPLRTLMVVEAGDAVPWTKPADLPYSPDQPLPKLGGILRGHFHASFADGSYELFAADTPEETLRPLISRKGEKAIQPAQ
jgi:hypothetical protein